MASGSNGEILLQRLVIPVETNAIDSALKHPSYLNEVKNCTGHEYNKGSQTLGKSLCKLTLAYHIYTSGIGDLKAYASLDGGLLAEKFYDYYKISELVYLGKGEIKSTKNKYIEIAYSIIYEIYKQNGFCASYQLLKRLMPENNQRMDYKTILQEYVQAQKGTVSYTVVKETGPDHEKQFEVEVKALGKEAIGKGQSKKIASIEAAYNYIDKYQVGIQSQASFKSDMIQINKSRVIENERLENLNIVLDYFQLNERDIPYNYLDICFTHSSIVNEIKHKRYTTNRLLGTVGARVLTFIVEKYLFENFEETCGYSYDFLINLRAAIVSNENIASQIPQEWIAILISSKGQKLAGLSTAMCVEIFDAIIGSLFIYGCRKKLDPFKKSLVIIKNAIDKCIENKASRGDDTSYLLELSVIIDREVTIMREWQDGLGHQLNSFVTLKCFDPTGVAESLVETGTGKSFKAARRNSSRKICERLTEQFGLIFGSGDLFFYNESKIISLQKLIDKVLSTTNYKFEEIVGGLSLSNWSKDRALIVAKLLHSKYLFKELQKLIQLWSLKYGFQVTIDVVNDKTLPDEVGMLLDNHEDQREDKTYSPRDVFTRLYSFSQACPFCGRELNKGHEYILVRNMQGYSFRYTDVLVCEECKVVGINKDINMELANEGVSILMADFSPYLFQSSIIKKSVPIIVPKSDSENTDRDICKATAQEVNSQNKNELLSLNLKDTKEIVTRQTLDNIVPTNINIKQKSSSPVVYNDVSIESSKSTKRKCSPEQLDVILQKQKTIGYLGEKYVFEREKRVLSEVGRGDLSEKVIWISTMDCAAGFDILSYHADGRTKYIEVKATSGYGRGFELSVNEWKTARQLGENYYIYRILNVTSLPVLDVLENPFGLAQNEMLELTPISFRVSYKEKNARAGIEEMELNRNQSGKQGRDEKSRLKEMYQAKQAEKENWERSIKQRLSKIDHMGWEQDS